MTSASDGWAVGYYDTTAGPQNTLILHWNGTSWTRIPSPNPSSGGDLLFSVSATSATDAWAVGWYYTEPGALASTLVLHWNGTSWTQVASPNPTPGASELKSVSASSASDAWAAGAAGYNTLTLHWNGTSWTHIKSPSPGDPINGGSQLTAVSDKSGTYPWAVGWYITRSVLMKTFTLHWNGTSWTHVPSPSPGTGLAKNGVTPNVLTGVSTVSASDAWAVGTYHTSTGLKTLLLHWNGTSWTHVASPEASGQLNGISLDSPSDGWAVGANYKGAARLLHRNGTSWTQF
jgi:hypothetical protein